MFAQIVGGGVQTPRCRSSRDRQTPFAQQPDGRNRIGVVNHGESLQCIPMFDVALVFMLSDKINEGWWLCCGTKVGRDTTADRVVHWTEASCNLEV
jgi:hypothetical protein